MKRYIANFNFYLIAALTLIYAAISSDLNLTYIVIACALIFINYYYLVDRLDAQQTKG